MEVKSDEYFFQLFFSFWGGGGGASIFRLGPSWFTNTLHLIIIYMSNIEAI